MRHYFYHGFEPFGGYNENVEHLLEIINSGEIKKRDEVKGISDGTLNHICLYRKNENYDYNSENALLHSARGGWIEHCMVFVISDEINAKYMPPNVEVENMGLRTNLVDEWRCFEDIPLDKVIGIAIPLDSLKETLDGKDGFSTQEEIEALKVSLKKLKDVCNQLGLNVYNSDKKDFTDLLDSQLQMGEKDQEEEIMI